MATMEKIEQQAKVFAESRGVLAQVCAQFQMEIEAVRLRYLARLKDAVAIAKSQHSQLTGLILESPELFKKPRSVVLHGVKLGYQKGKGRMVIEDEERTCALIEKHFADQAEVLIIATRAPAKKALEQLSVADLKKVGVIVTETGDVVFAKDAAAEVDKIVAAFLKDSSEEVEAESERRAA